MKYVLALIGLAIGVAAVVYGEADDSPGLQFMGGVLAMGMVAFTVQAVRRARRSG